MTSADFFRSISIEPLNEEKRGWLISTLETERRLVEAKRKVSLWESFWNPKVLWLTLNYFGIVTASVGILLFLPQIIKQLGLTNTQVGLVTMIPDLCAVVAMLAWGWVSDRLGERRWTLSLAWLVSAAALVIAAQNVGTVWALVGMSIAAMGFYGSKGPFWAMPSMTLSRGVRNRVDHSVGNLGGFFRPTMVGWAKQYTGSFAGKRSRSAGRGAVAVPHLPAAAFSSSIAKTDDESRALALSSGLGRTALVFDDNDVVDLLRMQLNARGQSAFARDQCINTIKHDLDRQESCARRDCGACRASQGVRRQVSAPPVSVLRKYHWSAEIAFINRKTALRPYFWQARPATDRLQRKWGIGPMKKLLLAAVALVVLAAGPAVAADLGRKAPAYIPPPAPPPPTFTGCYVNGGGGYGLWNIDHFGKDEFGAQTSTVTSGGRGWLGRVGGGCDYQFSPGSGFWSNWAVGAFADYDFMDLHRNFQSVAVTEAAGLGFAGEEKEKSAWAVGGRIGYLVTPNVFTYWNGGYTETRFDQINLSEVFSFAPGPTIDSHTYHGWFIGGGTEIALSGLFGLPLPSGLFWRSEYRYSSFNSANLPINFSGVPTGLTENMKPVVQTITTSLVYRFNWWGH